MPFPEDDPFQILDCAIRSRYLAVPDVPFVPFWNKLPESLQIQLKIALSQDSDMGKILRLIWKVRKELFGEIQNDVADRRNKIFVPLVIGLMYQTYLEGRMTVSELLSLSFHKADSYTNCGVDPCPFLWLRDDFDATGATLENQKELDLLFQPFINASSEYIQQFKK